MPEGRTLSRALAGLVAAAVVGVPGVAYAAQPVPADDPATLALDTTGPSYDGGSVTPTAVDVTNGPADLTVSVTASDAETAVVTATASAAGASVALAPTTAWTGTLALPASTAPGSYPVDVALTDLAGHVTHHTAADVRVTSATGDVTAPALAAVSAEPAGVDVSTEQRLVTVSAHLTDGGSGVGAAAARLGDGGSAPLALVSGDRYDGTWSGAVPVAAFTGHGALAAYVTTQDVLGNAAAPVAAAAVTVLDAAPAVPATLTLTANGTGSLDVDWTAPPANGGSPVEAYDVTADPGSTVSLPADARHTVLTGLTGTTVVHVAARNAAGTGTPATAEGTPTAAHVPAAPLALAAAPGNGTVAVSWAAPESDGGSPVTAYDVTAGTATVRVTGTTATIDGLVNGVAYDVSVAAVNAAGAGLPATVPATPRTVPGVPRTPAAKAGDRTATVTWTAPASDGGAPVTAYQVTGGGKTVSVPGTARTATVTGLPNGYPVTFTVKAVNVAGPGAASATTAAVTPRLPAHLVVVTQPAGHVVYGTASAVRVALLTAGGAAVPGRKVELWARVKPSTTFARKAYGTTDSTGHLTLRTTLRAIAALQVRHPADAVSAPTVTARSVYVATRVSASPSATTVRLGQTLTVRGGIAPAHPIGSAVRLQRYSSTGWVTVASGKMTTSTTYRVTWQPGATATYSLRVVKPADSDHVQGKSATWRQRIVPPSSADVAHAIYYDAGTTLETTHDSGVRDLATAKQNVADVMAGRLAHRSSYENAPGGYTTLDLRLLKALRRIGELGRVTVSEIAGGSHSVGSAHYSGRGLDISVVNGVHVAPGTSYGMVLDVCRAYGAVQVFHPGYDPYGGHSNHVHCGW